MTKKEAIAAMQEGDKVTHRYFSSDEYIYFKDGRIWTEEGYSISPDLFWADRTNNAWESD
jgi:hypothetical protein